MMKWTLEVLCDFLYTLKGMLVFSIAIIVLMFLLGRAWSATSCTRLQGITGKETRYDWMNGCFVRFEGQWIPESKWRHEE